MILSPLLHALADLVATEPRTEAQSTAAALRASDDTDFPPQTPTALGSGILHAAAHPDAHPTALLIHAAHQWLPWQDSPIASLQPTDLRAIKSIVTFTPYNIRLFSYEAFLIPVVYNRVKLFNLSIKICEKFFYYVCLV